MTRARRLGLRGAAVGLACGLLGWAPGVASGESSVEFTIRDARITESSGLATDVANERYWTVNDSGDSGIAYALTDQGRTEGTLRFRAMPTDVEAVALHDDRLYVADIGDNRENREFVTVYFFDEPAPDGEMRSYRAYDFSYPDGAHDAESLLVDGEGRLYLVTKEQQAGIYAAPAEPSRQEVNELERVADAPAFVTDGAYLPDGDRIALRTYTSIVVLDAASGETVAQSAAPIQPQGESMTVALDGEALLLGSEGRRSRVYRADIPTGVDDAPSPDATPGSPSPTQSETETSPGPPQEPAEDLDPDAEPEPAAGRRGTLLAIGLAGVVALVAGLVVVVVRKP